MQTIDFFKLFTSVDPDINSYTQYYTKGYKHGQHFKLKRVNDEIHFCTVHYNGGMITSKGHIYPTRDILTTVSGSYHRN